MFSSNQSRSTRKQSTFSNMNPYFSLVSLFVSPVTEYIKFQIVIQDRWCGSRHSWVYLCYVNGQVGLLWREVFLSILLYQNDMAPVNTNRHRRKLISLLFKYKFYKDSTNKPNEHIFYSPNDYPCVLHKLPIKWQYKHPWLWTQGIRGVNTVCIKNDIFFYFF